VKKNDIKSEARERIWGGEGGIGGAELERRDAQADTADDHETL
jgi:hypothetical protein